MMHCWLHYPMGVFKESRGRIEKFGISFQLFWSKELETLFFNTPSTHLIRHRSLTSIKICKIFRTFVQFQSLSCCSDRLWVLEGRLLRLCNFFLWNFFTLQVVRLLEFFFSLLIFSCCCCFDDYCLINVVLEIHLKLGKNLCLSTAKTATREFVNLRKIQNLVLDEIGTFHISNSKLKIAK